MECELIVCQNQLIQTVGAKKKKLHRRHMREVDFSRFIVRVQIRKNFFSLLLFGTLINKPSLNSVRQNYQTCKWFRDGNFSCWFFVWPKSWKVQGNWIRRIWNIEWAEHEITFRRRLINECMPCGEPMSQRMKRNLYVCIWTCVRVGFLLLLEGFRLLRFVYGIHRMHTINTCNYGQHAKIQMWMRTFCGNSVRCAFQFKMRKPFGFERLLLQMNIRICSYEREWVREFQHI